jgi:hypothetical protein
VTQSESLALMQTVSWETVSFVCVPYSPNFLEKEFSEVLASDAHVCYLVCKRSGGERLGESEEKACDDE